jgi:hypothetical protein
MQSNTLDIMSTLLHLPIPKKDHYTFATTAPEHQAYLSQCAPNTFGPNSQMPES